MKKNAGTIDRILRIVIGIVALGAGYYYESWWGLVGIVPLLTAAMGSCPLYSIFGLSTCPMKASSK